MLTMCLALINVLRIVPHLFLTSTPLHRFLLLYPFSSWGIWCRGGSETSPKSQNYCSEEDLGFNLGKPGLCNQQIMINCYLGAYRQQHSLYSCFIVYTEIIRCVGTWAKTGWLWMVCKAFGVAISSLFKVSFYDTLYLHLGNLWAALAPHWYSSELQKNKTISFI